MFKRIKYASRHSRPMSSGEIDEIVMKSQISNELTGITGVFLSTGAVFFQIIEGPPHAVDALFDKIRRDARNTDVVTLAVQVDRTERLFGSWNMRPIAIADASQTRAVEAAVAEAFALAGRMAELDASISHALATALVSPRR